MQTLLKKITPQSLKEAKEILLSGGAVAFPTETVYGLGADARSDDAVEQIFRIKGRPSDNPLIVHVHSDYDLSVLVKNVKPYVQALREAFLPGPLTLVYESRGTVSPKVSCGLETLAVRVPSHAGAQELLRYVDMPIAAPSANISKHVSPVTAEHVYADLAGKVPLILDGGQCSGGIESTVCDVTGDIPVVLRSGLISQEMIESVVGCCETYTLRAGEAARSPGMKYKHYSPRCRTKLFPSEALADAENCFREIVESGETCYILCENAVCERFPSDRVLDLGKNEFEMAANLYDLLRRGEREADVIVAIEPAKKDGVMAGVLNRLRKACAD